MPAIALIFLLIALLMVITAFFPSFPSGNFSAGPVVTPARLIGLVIGLVVLYVIYLLVVSLFGSTLHLG